MLYSLYNSKFLIKDQFKVTSILENFDQQKGGKYGLEQTKGGEWGNYRCTVFADSIDTTGFFIR